MCKTFFRGVTYFWRVTLSSSDLTFLLSLSFHLSSIPTASGCLSLCCLWTQVQLLSQSRHLLLLQMVTPVLSTAFSNSKSFSLLLNWPFLRGRGHKIIKSKHKQRSNWEIRYQSSIMNLLDTLLFDLDSWQQHCSPTLSQWSKLMIDSFKMEQGWAVWGKEALRKVNMLWRSGWLSLIWAVFWMRNIWLMILLSIGF